MQTFQDILTKLDASHPDHAPLHRALTRIAEVGHPGYLPKSVARQFFEDNTGRKVDTAQIMPNGGVWCPIYRTVDASRKTYVQLDGSRRDYSDLTPIYCHDGILWCAVKTAHGTPGAVVYVVR